MVISWRSPRAALAGLGLSLLLACGGPAAPTSQSSQPSPDRSAGGEREGDAEATARDGHGASTTDVENGPRLGAQAMLWKLSTATATVYLLGSIHVGTPDFYPLPPAMESAFAQADVVAFEVDLSPDAQAAAASALMREGTYPRGHQVWSEITPETARLLRAQLQQLEQPAEAVEHMRPWLLAVTFTMAAYLQAGLQPALGVDQHLFARAQLEGKRIVAIETPEAQLKALGGHPAEVQDLMLREALENLDELGEGIDRLTRLWLSGDADALADEIHGSMKRPEYADLYRALVLDRNVVMAKAVRGYLKQGGTTLVVVGSGHLVGEGSVVSLLSAEYRVEQLPSGRAEAVPDMDEDGDDEDGDEGPDVADAELDDPQDPEADAVLE